jgi:HD-like signal output (HDOD) protein
MKPVVFELTVSDNGVAEPGLGVLAAYMPADADYRPLVVAGCDPRHDPGNPIEGLAGPVFAYIYKSLVGPRGLRCVVVDNWGRFFEASLDWTVDADRSPIVEFRRFPDGVGIDAFAKAVGPAGEAALELLSAVVEGGRPPAASNAVRLFIEAILGHDKLPVPGTLFQVVSDRVNACDSRGATHAIQLDRAISVMLVNYANAAFPDVTKTGLVSEAVQRLGIKRVPGVVFIAEIMARYPTGACREFDYRAYWRNAIATGAVTRGLIGKYGIPEQLADDAFALGLFSGIGWLTIAETFPGLMADYIVRARNADPIVKARLQQEIFPCSINRVSETYLARFDFPETMRAVLSGRPNGDGWGWFDCLAEAIRGSQALAPFECLAVPTDLPAPEPCLEEWQHWKSLVAMP